MKIVALFSSILFLNVALVHAQGFTNVIGTVAGVVGVGGSADGIGANARFNTPHEVAVDGAGDVFVADQGNHTIRELTLTGTNWVSATIAGQAGVEGNADGSGTNALFNNPAGVAVDGGGNVFVADEGNQTIRELTPGRLGWQATTIAGKAGNAGSADGTNSAARFNSPSGLAMDASDDVYVADWGNHTIRELIPSGTNWNVITIAGLAGNKGTSNGTNSVARFDHPEDVAVDASGDVYVADWGNHAIREMTPAGTNWNVSTIAGVAGSTNYGSADGVGGAAQFYYPSGLALDNAGNIYVADTFNDTIRELTFVSGNWNVSTVAGTAGAAGSADGLGTNARLYNPCGVAVDSSNNLFVADTGNQTVRGPSAPIITLQPQSQITPVGSNVVFSVSDFGTLPLSYQWLKNGTNIVGATNQTFTITNIQAGDTALYNVVISNLYGSATSFNAQLTVIPPPGIYFFEEFTNVDFTAAGYGGMRGNGVGSITLTNVTGTIKQALLYWHGPGDSIDTTANATVNFAGTSVTGVSIGFSSDNSWGFNNSQAYRADVTSLVTGNGTYALTNFYKGSTADVNGASLIVFFDDGNPNNNRDVYVYNGNDSNLGSTYDPPDWFLAMTNLVYASNTNVSLTLHVSDGQLTWDDAEIDLNGAQLISDGSIFDGDSVPPYIANGLWDIETYDVTSFFANGTNNLTLTSGLDEDALSLIVATLSFPANVATNFSVPSPTISGPSVYGNLVAATPNLLGYWPFSTASQANSSVNGYTGTFIGNAAIGSPGSGPALVNGLDNTAVVLDGTNSYVDTTLVGGLSTTGTNANQGSIVAWFKLTALPSNIGHFFSIAGESQTGNDFDLQIETDNELKFYTDSGSATVDTTAFTTNDLNVWHFAAATFTGGTSRNLYLDGQLVASSTPGSHNPAIGGTFAMGYSDAFSGRYFSGSLDEIAVFNRQLTGSEVTNLYAAAVLPAFSSPAQNVTVTNGDPVSFTITASGATPLFYQWQKNGINLADGGNISGSGTNTLNLSTTSTNDDGNYFVIITNAYGSVTSSVVTLTVIVPISGSTNGSGTNLIVLHTFSTLNSSTNADGAVPQAGLILSGNNLYGTAYYGGTSGYGAVFKVNTDGTGFTNLYSFTNGSDGAYPSAGLILSGNNLYGTASAYLLGGKWGTVFAINTNGTGFTNLYNFTAGSDGGYPVASLILSGNTLYGTAAGGGSSPYGTVFAVNTNGTGFTNLYSFTGGGDGAYPNAGLILSGNILYGTTLQGGSSGYGAVFAINTNGTGFTNLYSFTNGSDGANPVDSLILSGGTLYGTAANGGSSGGGTVFAVNTNGTGFTNLHTFFYTSDGDHPGAGLILSGNTLYGTARNGGTNNEGTVFAVSTDGTGFTNLYSFTGGGDGSGSQASLVLSSNTLYGTAANGGTNGEGTVFALAISVSSGPPASITWTNASGGNWTNAANWSPNQVPGSLDTATAILGVTITVGSPVTVSNFTFNGTLGGSGALTVLGNMNWVSGELDGALTTGAGGVLNMNNSSYSLDGTLTNFGTMAWTNATLFGYTNAQIYNAGLFLIQSDDALYNWDGLTNKLFVNTGTIRKTGGAGTTEIEWPFTTTGTLDIQSGALELDDWTGTNILNGNLNSDSSVLNGTLTVTTNSVLNILDGNLSGAMTVNVGGTLTLTNNAGYSLYGALTNFGTLVWSNSDLFGYTNAQIYNAGLFLIQSDDTLYNWDSLTNKLFVNAGTVRKTGGTGTSEIEWPFDDSGVVDVQSGTLDLDDWEGSTLQDTTGSLAGNLNGTMTVISGTTMNWSGNLNGAMTVATNAAVNWLGGTLNGTATVASGGALMMTNNSSYSLAGALTNFGTMVWSNATFFGYANAQIYNAGLFLIQSDDVLYNWDGLTNKLFVNTGTVRKTGGAGETDIEWPFTTTGTMDIQSGWFYLPEWIGTNTLTGVLNSEDSTLTGTLTVATNGVWNLLSGDTLDGALTVNAGGTLNFSGASFNFYSALTNFGTMIWSNSTIFGYTNAQIYNAGLCLIPSDSTLYNWDSLPNKLFVNTGTVRKTGGTGTSEIDWPFNDSGAMDIQSGILSIGSSFNFSGSPTLDIAIGGTSPGTGFSQLQLNSYVTLAGTLNVTFKNGFQPAISNSFTFLTVNAGVISGNFASFLYPSNVVGLSLTNTFTSSTLLVTNIMAPVPVQIISPQVSGGSFNLSFQTVNGQGYTLYYNDNLATTNWLPYTNVSGNGGALQLTVPTTNSVQRFFRIGEP